MVTSPTTWPSEDDLQDLVGLAVAEAEEEVRRMGMSVQVLEDGGFTSADRAPNRVRLTVAGGRVLSAYRA